MTEAKPVPQVVHVAVCKLCGTPSNVATGRDAARLTACGHWPDCDGEVTVERFRHDPPVSRNGRKPRKWKR